MGKGPKLKVSFSRKRNRATAGRKTSKRMAGEPVDVG